MREERIIEIEQLCDEGAWSEADARLSGARRSLNQDNSFRSALMLSPQQIKHLLKIPRLEAECIMLNLEDGVSEALKPKALRLCAAVLSELPTCKQKLVVRVNALDEGGEAEIRYLNRFMPDAIRIPKVRSVQDVQRALELVEAPIGLHLSIETKEAWLALSTLRIDERVEVMYLGILDLFADLHLPQSLITPNNPAMHYLLSHFLLTCKAMGVKPVSFVVQEYRNEALFAQWLELERSMGFESKGCIAPAQVVLVHHYFGCDSEALRRAQSIIALFEQHAALGVSGFVDERYGFIDEPIYKGALSMVRTCKENR
ncbi:MAG: CoA ester lyase [Campylobacterales bacterium]|nr:CoA ester lyase [Campylobacterales bacterium]